MHRHDLGCRLVREEEGEEERRPLNLNIRRARIIFPVIGKSKMIGRVWRLFSTRTSLASTRETIDRRNSANDGNN